MKSLPFDWIEDLAEREAGDLSPGAANAVRSQVRRLRVRFSAEQVRAVTAGLRFFEELRRVGRRRVPAGNCVAVIPANVCPDGSIEAIGALFESPNSPVCGTAVSRDWLRGNCRRVSAAYALKAHPRLRDYLTEGGAA